ncbi:signal peptidase I [Microbacterium sp. SD291]|uniref:signal peptidase I n=1 Tax=Microbacterium sp. SD291 TaxID=2782007 RepID=UPI001A95F096|nr:signal peptidase I [Microbacterium sp. SD291]MBO0980994.1 signal peptidase I [Microbacterium sp. SD291]
METPESPPMWRRITSSAWFHLFAAFLVSALVLSFVAKPYYVPSGSMQETLMVGDRVLVNRLAYLADGPSPGDIVVFEAGDSWGVSDLDEGPLKSMLRWVGEVTGFGPSGPHTLIKRVIAGPGQTVSCCTADGRLIVDGEPIDEPYVFEDLAFEAGELDCATTPRSSRCLPEAVVPAGSYLMLGDHRSVSADGAMECRVPGADDAGCYRWMRREDVVGRAVVILWPVPRWSGL